MQRREAAHRQSDDMRLPLADVIEHGEDIVGGAGLRIGGDMLRHVGRWEAARVERDGAIALAKMAHLRLVAAQIAGKFVNQDHGTARSCFLEIQAHPVIRRGVRHVGLRSDIRDRDIRNPQMRSLPSGTHWCDPLADPGEFVRTTFQRSENPGFRGACHRRRFAPTCLRSPMARGSRLQFRSGKSKSVR